MKETNKKRKIIESFTFFLLFFVGIGIVSYGGFFLYKKYSAEFTASSQPIIKVTTQKPFVKQEDRSITKQELKRAIQKVLEEKSDKQQKETTPQDYRFYYRIELVNGGKIEADSTTRDGDIFTIKERKGLVISVNRKEIKNIKKIKL